MEIIFETAISWIETCFSADIALFPFSIMALVPRKAQLTLPNLSVGGNLKKGLTLPNPYYRFQWQS